MSKTKQEVTQVKVPKKALSAEPEITKVDLSQPPVKKEEVKKIFSELMNKRHFEIRPVLKITSTEVTLPWQKDKVTYFDIAKLSFLVNGEECSLKNLLPLVIEREANKEFSEKDYDELVDMFKGQKKRKASL